MTRWMAGAPRKNRSFAASSMNSPGTRRTHRYGPLPTGAWTNGERASESGGIFASRWAGIGAT